jgi:hypothetical protein
MTYTFRQLTDGKIISVELKISEYDAYVAAHPLHQRWIESAPCVSYNGKHFGSLDAQTDQGFKEVLAKIGEKHPNTPLGNKYRKNKTIKDVRTVNAVKKNAIKLHKKLLADSH